MKSLTKPLLLTAVLTLAFLSLHLGWWGPVTEEVLLQQLFLARNTQLLVDRTELEQDASGIGLIHRFAQNFPPQAHGGVGAEHGRKRQALALHALHSGVEFEPRDTRHITRRRFRAVHVFQRLGIFIGPGQEQLVGHPDLVKQLAAPGALGSEVDEVAHSRW